MGLSVGTIEVLLKPLLSIGLNEWKKTDEYILLRRLACERLARELSWNIECIDRTRQGKGDEFVKLIRTNAFDSLVEASVPIDRILSDRIRSEWVTVETALHSVVNRSLYSAGNVSELLDHAYHGIWMLKRVSEDRTIAAKLQETYALNVFSLAHIMIARRTERPNRLTFQSFLSRYTL